MIKKKIITAIIAMAMLCMMSMSVFAANYEFNVHISLPKNMVWIDSMSFTRSGKYSYAWASLDSVYPSSGTDIYTKIQARLVNSSGTVIMKSDKKVLEEGDGAQELHIKEGFLDLTTIYIQFRGNTNNPAEAVVNYGGN